MGEVCLGGWGGGGDKPIYLKTRPQVKKKMPKFIGLFRVFSGGLRVGVGGVGWGSSSSK